MKWIGERVSFVDDKLKTTIVIYPQTATIVKGLMSAWVAMWFTIGAVVAWSFFTFELTDQELIILFVFMAFWFYYAVRVSRSLFWLLWGKELIKIDETAFLYKRSVKNFGKAVPYYLENISKMRVFQPKEKSIQAAWELSPWIKGAERIEFDYMGKEIRFARKLNEKDTEMLFKFITKKMNDRLKKSK